jgi:hypothetical protein
VDTINGGAGNDYYSYTATLKADPTGLITVTAGGTTIRLSIAASNAGATVVDTIAVTVGDKIY